MALTTAPKGAQSPELERDFHRHPDLGYEPEGAFGFIRCLEHGAPNPLIRWHYHAEYELHLIVATSGKVFVGDHIGRFTPGHLVLTGPRLPHNWISTEMPEKAVAVRDRVVQFADEPLRKMSETIPEIKEVFPLLERARHGVEFEGISEAAGEYMTRIRHSSGLQRLIAFFRLLQILNRHEQYHLLSRTPMQCSDDDASLKKISEIVDYISANYPRPFSMPEIARHFGMSPSRFSRYFRKCTGNTFTSFVNQVRVTRACQLLMETDQYVSSICYHVGFNNLANFNRRFVEIKGMTPSEFRHNSQERFFGQQ